MSRVRLTLVLMASVATGCSGDDGASGAVSVAPSAPSESASFDPCDLLLNTDVRNLLGGTVGEPVELPGSGCTVSSAEDLYKGASLHVASSDGAVNLTLVDFVEQQAPGLSALGVSASDVQVIDDLGDFAIWFEGDFGVQLWAWGQGHSLIGNVTGVETASALSWLRSVAQRVVSG